MLVAEALKIFGTDVRVASLNAIRKSDDTFRVVHDCAHSVGANGQIRPPTREGLEAGHAGSRESNLLAQRM